MNENIDLTKILKDCPKGTKLYSTIHGEVTLIDSNDTSQHYPISVRLNDKTVEIFTYDGKLLNKFDGECILFPSKDQRDWSKFTAPWLKKERDTIASLEEQSKKEYRLKSSKDEDVRKFMQYIEKQAKVYEFNLPNRCYDIYAFAKDLLVWLEKQGKKSSWKPSKEEMDVLYSLSYITNKYDEHKEDVITHLYQDLKREFFNGSSYENMFSLDNKEDDVRRRSTIQVLEYARSLDAYNQYGKADIDKNIAWLKEQGEQEVPQVYETEDGEIITYSEKTLEKLSEPKFDPKTLKPFDKVLVKISNESYNTWFADFVTEPSNEKNETPLILGAKEANLVIPYNDETKHLIGTTDEAPEYYRYWED